jgi:hypothetical protein
LAVLPQATQLSPFSSRTVRSRTTEKFSG